MDHSTQSIRTHLRSIYEIFESPSSIESLNNLKEHLRSVKFLLAENEDNVGLKKEILDHISLDSLFNLLTIPDHSVQFFTCKILDILLKDLSYQQVEELKDYVVVGLKNSEIEVLKLVYNQLKKFTVNTESIHLLVGYIPLILDKFASEEITTYELSSQFFQSIPVEAISVLFNDSSFQISTQNLLKQTGVIRFRVYDLLIDFFTKSQETFSSPSSSSYLQYLENEYHSDDILLKINSLELLAKLGSSSHGCKYLIEHKLVNQIVNDINNTEDSPLRPILISNVLKFFSRILESPIQPLDILHKNFSILDIFQKCLSDKNVEIKMTAIESIGNICSEPDRLVYVSKNSKLIDEYMRSFRFSVDETKAAFYRGISCIMSVKNNNDETIETLTHQIFLKIGGEPSPLLKLIADGKQVFNNTRYAVYSLFESMATHRWAIELFHYDPFINYILNRQLDNTYEGKKWRYSIVKSILKSPHTQEIFNSRVAARFEKYERDGPFYTPTEAAVALGSA